LHAFPSSYVNTNIMNPVTREWWEIRRAEILEGRRSRVAASGGGDNGGDLA
jgi:hypothetical protein